MSQSKLIDLNLNGIFFEFGAGKETRTPDGNFGGGVIPSNGKLMTIVPVDEKLLVEARLVLLSCLHPN